VSALATTLVSVIACVMALASGLGSYFVAHRLSSGRVATSNAEVLWQQSQAMYDAAIKERDEARGQRDKLMTAQADQVIPILSAVLQAVQQIRSAIEVMDAQTKSNSQVTASIMTAMERLVRKYG
jgi:hypothetical protein